MPSLWPFHREVFPRDVVPRAVGPNNSTRPAIAQKFQNPALTLNTSPTGHALGGNTTDLPLATTIQPFDFTPVLTNDVGPAELVTLKQGLFKNLTSLAVRALPVLTPILPIFLGEVVDWRTRYGGSWLATIQNQDPCGNCWAFAATALGETMIRIEHGLWSKRSEADLRDSWGLDCAHGANVNDAINWVINHGGLSDLDCVPWHYDDDNYYPCPDRSGRAGRFPEATQLGPITDQKNWLATVGPITASFSVYNDFYGWTGPDPYKYDGVSNYSGGHVVLLVGYNDIEQAWIARNSWGDSFGEDGYFLIGYGQADIDTWAKQGWTNLSPDPWSRRRLHNGNLIQSSNGQTHRNFEMAVGTSPVTTVYRVGEAPFAWAPAYTLLDEGEDGKDFSADGAHPGINCIGQPALTSTSYNRDFEMVYWEFGGWLRRWYFSQNSQQWQNTGHIGDGHTAGFPGFIESNGGGFDIVVRSDEGTLDHWYRTPDNAWSWYYGGTVAYDVLQSGPSLVQSNVGSTGNFYVVAVLPSGQMQLFWKDNDSSDSSWQAGEIFGTNVGGTPPVMIEGQFGTVNELSVGNFELVVVVDGQAQHWWRDNSDLATDPPQEGVQGKWQQSATFGQNLINAWGLVDGSYGNNLELIVEQDDTTLAHWFRAGSVWSESTVINA
ncbi:MAG: hypothetical protein M1838_001703 [Thelocarpon superellum]|nr:MAG: hypothetical protein M1838_001703 [Thelocarpon superellum]